MQYQAKFTPTIEDVLIGFNMHNGRSSDFWKAGVAGGLTAIVVFSIGAFLFHFLMLAIISVIIGVSVGCAQWLAELNIRRVAKKSRFEELTFSFSEEGVGFSNSTTQAKYTWNEIKKTRLDERGVVLDFGALGYLFNPARAFAGNHFPLQELKLLLSHKK
ncbi:MAG TPA: hypothetical protein VFV23_04830 [Verrucomicrobiae bacterium]|nr:hypothetical protein [Verrucomicrobiae bacterium]